MKKHGRNFASLALIFLVLAGCAKHLPYENAEFLLSESIVPINRESDSGTKISFLEFLNLEEKSVKGNK